MIPIRECLKLMHSGAVFSATVVKFDRRRRDKCGPVLEIQEGQLLWATTESNTPQRGATKREASAQIAFKRDPEHGLNYSRNVRLLAGGRETESIVKIHPLLIIRFNGQTTCP